ncbi:MAG: sugar transferase [Patulibacter minatonensis]
MLRGEMSLVGPAARAPRVRRPLRRAPTPVRRPPPRARRHHGWAQVNGLRGQTSIAERIEWDNWYIQNWSLGLDLLTIAMTPLAILQTPKEEASNVTRSGTAASG